jgi:hypothetical protein
MSNKSSKRQKKKRVKKYAGQDVAVTKTTVTRVTAPDRSKFGEWFNENRKRIAGYGIVLGLGLIFYFLVSLILRLIF